MIEKIISILKRPIAFWKILRLLVQWGEQNSSNTDDRLGSITILTLEKRLTFLTSKITQCEQTEKQLILMENVSSGIYKRTVKLKKIYEIYHLLNASTIMLIATKLKIRTFKTNVLNSNYLKTWTFKINKTF